MEVLTAHHLEDLDVPDATPPAGFGRPDLTTFARLDGLGLVVIGQRLEPDRAVLACRVVESDQWCRRCGGEGLARDTVIRRLAHEPLGRRPTTLEVAVRRYRCRECGHVWRQDTTAAAEPRAKLSRTGLRWALEGIVVQHLTVARMAKGLGVAWDTANNAVLAEGRRVLIEDPARFDGVAVIGVDEHVWRHTRPGDKYVTVIIDLTLVRDGIGPARLLGMVEGRSKSAFKTWLADRSDAWRDGVQVVVLDGFTGFKTAAAEEVPDAVAVMDPFHVDWPGMHSTAADAGSSSRSTATAGSRTTRSTSAVAPWPPARTCSSIARPTDSERSSPRTTTSRSRRPGASTSG